MANFQALLWLNTPFPAPLRPLLTLVRESFSSYTGTLLTDNDAQFSQDVVPEPSKRRGRARIPPDLSFQESQLLQTLRIPENASLRVHPYFTRGNARFEPIKPRQKEKWEAGKNSSVSFQAPDGLGIQQGRITRIVEVEDDGSSRILALIEPYERLGAEDAEVHDPFRRYPELGAGIYYNSFGAVCAVPSSKIVGHVARCKWDSKRGLTRATVALISLDRVSSSMP